MGRHKKRTIQKHITTVVSSPAEPTSSSEVLECVESFLSLNPPDEISARQLFEKTLSNIELVKDWRILASYADLLCNAESPLVRDTQRAIALFESSISIENKQQPERYFNLAQALATYADRSKDAEIAYRTGIELLDHEAAELKAQGNIEGFTAAAKMAASAYCSITELYLTDLCDSPEAETKIAESIEMALQLDPESFDAHASKTTYLKTIGDIDAAIENAQKALNILSKIKADTEKTNNLVSLLKQGDDSLNVSDMPQWNSRLSFAASLVDLQLLEPAQEILEDLLEENENSVEAWHIMACSFFISKDTENAKGCVESAQKLLQEACKNIDASSNKVNEELQQYIQHWNTVLENLEKQLNVVIKTDLNDMSD